jgi:prepilin-type N-terminal cleavage/methylation domain-containing protein
MTPRSRRPDRGPRGFTLLELLITLSVTTIGLIGLLALHLSIARGNNGANRAAEAEQITATALEDLRAQSPRTMMKTLTGNPLAVPPATAAAVTFRGRNGLPYSVTRSVTALTAVSPSLWLVRVSTSWGEEGAAIGSAGDPLTHTIALEVIRTIEEQL